MNTKKAIMSIILALLLGASVIVPTIVFLKPSDNLHIKPINYKFMYPDPIFIRGTLSDMVLESDDRIRFMVHSMNSSYNTPVYLEIDHKQNNCTFEMMSEELIYGYPHQLRLGISPTNQTLVYMFVTTPSFYDVGRMYYLEEGEWKSYVALDDWPNPYSPAYKGTVYNWHFTDTQKINVAFLYQDYAFTTPAIYNETTDSFLFLKDVFSEIQGHDTINLWGDFQVVDSNIFFLWERYIDAFHHHTYLGIKWGGEEWQLSSIGDSNSTLIPLMILPQTDSVNVFYYDNGHISNNSSLHRMQIFNSTYNQTSLITQFNGTVSLRYDSVKLLADNEFVFFYQGKENYYPNTQYDLFMGYYD